jgi:hypothetical protein
VPVEIRGVAKAKDISMARILRDYIKRLPKFSRVEKSEEE